MSMKNDATPACIGIIMDGNRRFAKEHQLPSLEGHRLGYEKLREVLSWARESEVKNVIVYAFSTENWDRSPEEVAYLMDLLRSIIPRVTKEAVENSTRILFLGDRERLDAELRDAIAKAEESTKNGHDLTFGIALSYGGRAEILDAIHRIPPQKISSITEEEFSALLWTRDIPDPDIILRTSGEHRTSGFLPWQSVYSELFFSGTHWPAFTKEEFTSMLEAYAKRHRRFGT
jgi:undecaprenyl diphosphate synthase